MKTLKYGLSGLVMAALTLLFLCIPTLYYRLTDRENANVSTREIYLEQTADPLIPQPDHPASARQRLNRSLFTGAE